MPKQLLMTRPPDCDSPEITVPTGYTLRNYRPGDDEAYISLMHAAGFDDWGNDNLVGVKECTVPDGIFFIEHDATGSLTATAFGEDRPHELFPDGRAMGWVAGDPAHAGKGLGRAVCAAVVSRLRELGHKQIYLLTDDFRLPAIKIYLKLGFVPVHDGTDMPGRWKAVFDRLKLDKDAYPPHIPRS